MAEKTFRQWVVERRTAVPLTQDELARRSGVSAKTIAAIEQGGILDPRLSTVTAIQAALGGSFFGNDYHYTDNPQELVERSAEVLTQEVLPV